MAVVTQIPSPSEPLTRDKGLVTTPWFQFFMHVFNTVSPGGGPAPANGGYVVTGADPSLPNSRVATSSATVTVNVATPGVIKWDALGGSGSGDVVGPASAIDDRIATFDGVTGKLIQDGGATIAAVLNAALAAAKAAMPGTIGAAFDGGGVAPAAGTVRYVLIPYAHVIQAVALLAVPPGSAVVDVWRLAFGAALPTVADTITASAKPTISSASTSADVTLAGWSTSGAANTVYAFHLDSASTLTALQVQLVVART